MTMTMSVINNNAITTVHGGLTRLSSCRRRLHSSSSSSRYYGYHHHHQQQHPHQHPVDLLNYHTHQHRSYSHSRFPRLMRRSIRRRITSSSSTVTTGLERNPFVFQPIRNISQQAIPVVRQRRRQQHRLMKQQQQLESASPSSSLIRTCRIWRHFSSTPGTTATTSSGNAASSSTSTTTAETIVDDPQQQESLQSPQTLTRPDQYPTWITQLDPTQPMDSRRAFTYLQLDHFNDDELIDRFHRIVSASATSSGSTSGSSSNSGSSVITGSSSSSSSDDPNNVHNDSVVSDMDIARTATITESNLRSYIHQTILDFESTNIQHGYVNQFEDDDDDDDYNKIQMSNLRTEYVNRETQRLLNFFLTSPSASSSFPTIPMLSPSSSSSTATTTPTTPHSTSQSISITQDQFVQCITQNAQSVDIRRVWPLALSMIMVGSTVGVTTPAMPFVVQQLGITTAEYGWVVSAFALSKMMGNIPFAVLVERYGRKPYLVYSMMVISAGVGGIGLATGFESLYVCRLLTGLGVAALSTAATLTVTDISTPLNRASTFAPIMSGFAAGTAVGPALGGYLVDAVGTTQTFTFVGMSYIALAGMNTMLLDETKPIKGVPLPWQDINNGSNNKSTNGDDPSSSSSIGDAFQSALGQWVPLLQQAPVRNVCIMNAFYWVALAGSQMTLLPLILTDPDGLALSAGQVGTVYMGMSVVQVFGGPVFAKVVDHVGKVPGIVGGCSLISASMATLPMCHGSLEQMAGVLALWATGSTLLSTSPLAYVSDQVDDDQRAQAIALLRTSGDVGFLIGASSMGALADWAGSLDMAMQSSAAILLTATGWFTARSVLTAQLDQIK